MKTKAKDPGHAISEKFEGERLDRVLQTLWQISRKKAKSLLDQGRIRVNGRKVIIASWEMKAGDRIQVEGEEREGGGYKDPTHELGKDYFLKVVFEDKELIVVEKEAGVGCEQSALSTRPTIVSIINAYFKRKMPHLKHHYLGLVHRLDRDTSGLMVYSKTKEANKIIDQFKRHTIKRKYLAVVEGRIEKASGRIEGFLQKSDLLTGGKKVKISTEESGRPAVTLYKVVERYGNATLVELTLNTGRTHQIRVHMASIGHGVVGDRVYGSNPPKIPFGRQALHSSFLSFHHPLTGEKKEFSSELPRDLRRLVERLRLRS